MTFTDAIDERYKIVVVAGDGDNSGLVDIEMLGDHGEVVYLTKQDAKALGEHLIGLSDGK